MVTGFFDGGECGIRTHVPLRTTAFRVRLVMTTSITLPLCSAAVFLRLFPVKKGFGKNWRKEQQTYSIFEPGKTRMVTRFRLDETDNSPQNFECCTFDHSDNSPYVNPKIISKTFGKDVYKRQSYNREHCRSLSVSKELIIMRGETVHEGIIEKLYQEYTCLLYTSRLPRLFRTGMRHWRIQPYSISLQTVKIRFLI